MPVKSTLKKYKIKWTYYYWKENNSKKTRSEVHERAVLSFRECWLWKCQQMRSTKYFTVIHEMSFCCCGTHVQISWVRCWLVWGCLSMLLRDIQSVYVMPMSLWDLSHAFDPMFRVWGNCVWFFMIASNQGLLATGFREALYQMPGVFYLSLV